MIEKLREIAKVLRKEETDFSELTQALKAFEKLALKTAETEMESWENRENIYAKTGMALGTTWAAMCIQDILRTKLFIKGVFEAIEVLKTQKKKPVNILYAGTGPFATLLLPVLASYAPEDLQCVLLEINTNSFLMMQSVINKLGFKDHVKAFVNEDATTYRVNPEHDIDILLSETMQRALVKEQQVPIMMNLVPQLKPEVLLIPERISLEVGLMDIGEFLSQNAIISNKTYLKLGVFYELTKNNILDWTAKIKQFKEVICFPKKIYKIPAGVDSRHKELTIQTGITIFGTTELKINESGLTMPLILQELNHNNKSLELQIYYKVDKVPGVIYSLT